MKSMTKLVYFMAFTMALATSLALATIDRSSLVRGASHRLLGYNPRGRMTCNRFPRVCRITGSPGPNCCHKRCVDVMTDNSNCGECGRQCQFREACCNGNCVNVMYDHKNCGNCNNKCKKGT